MRSILVTGGNRGIGKEICRQLAEQGHQVYLGSRDLAKGQAVAASMPGHITAVQLEVGNEESMASAVAGIPQLDALINNAAVMPGNRNTASVPMEDIYRAFQSNFFGVLRLSQLCIPLLQRSADPRIVNLSSGMGEHASLQGGGYAAYRLTKAALNDLTILMAADLPGFKINAVCPGWVKTDMGGAGAQLPVSQGADTPVWLATAEGIPSGKFFRDRQVIPY